MIDVTATSGIAFLPFFPVAIGEHTRPGGMLTDIANELDALPGEVALAWLLARSPDTVPIPGTTSTTHLEQNVAARNLRLNHHTLRVHRGHSATWPETPVVVLDR